VWPLFFMECADSQRWFLQLHILLLLVVHTIYGGVWFASMALPFMASALFFFVQQQLLAGWLALGIEREGTKGSCQIVNIFVGHVAAQEKILHFSFGIINDVPKNHQNLETKCQKKTRQEITT